ncbi:MAG: phosphoribosylanthranilate isomerase [Gammaproteobacteria bacterium]|nr:phosphoribosylanthranilate isomerase [Gammaproteobacteria bacterium]
MFVKICGLTSAEAVAAAVAAGADALGFVFAESARRLSPERARELTQRLPAHIVRVAVMLRPTAEEWEHVHSVFAPDWLQTEAADFERLTVPAEVGRLPVYRDRQSVDYTSEAHAWPEHILFEGARSGVGFRPNWTHAAQIARQTCLMLAGGLSPENVREAIIQVHPWGVDVSSGVESSPGHKDPVKIAAFVRAAREAEGSNAG